jgi:hypothetical protein
VEHYGSRRVGPTSFAIFDTFGDEAGRQRHRAGDCAVLMARASGLRTAPPAARR